MSQPHTPKEFATASGQKTESIYKKIQRGQVNDLPPFIRLSSGPKAKIMFLKVEEWLEERTKITRDQVLKKGKGGDA